jgi:hypothetical protein
MRVLREYCRCGATNRPRSPRGVQWRLGRQWSMKPSSCDRLKQSLGRRGLHRHRVRVSTNEFLAVSTQTLRSIVPLIASKEPRERLEGAMTSRHARCIAKQPEASQME